MLVDLLHSHYERTAPGFKWKGAESSGIALYTVCIYKPISYINFTDWAVINNFAFPFYSTSTMIQPFHYCWWSFVQAANANASDQLKEHELLPESVCKYPEQENNTGSDQPLNSLGKDDNTLWQDMKEQD